jgi:isoamylase
LRCKYPILRNRRFLSGEVRQGSAIRDVTWINPAGVQVEEQEWTDPGMHCFGMLLDGRAIPNGNGHAAAFLLVMNSHFEDVPFTLPQAAGGSGWRLLIDTNKPETGDQASGFGEIHNMTARSFLLFLLEVPPQS